MYNKKLYKLISDDTINDLNELSVRAKVSCRQGLREIYKESLGCEALCDLITAHANFSEQNAMEKACSKYYLSAFKESVEVGQTKDPHNFTTELHFWEDNGNLLVAGSTAWGSARFLDFLEDTEFLSRSETNDIKLRSITNRPPLMIMRILTPKNYHTVDPIWGS